MAPSTKSLKVTEKFRAPAALYIPSKNKGGGWAEVSRPGMGGQAIIQVQDDATMNGKCISVVRFLMRHGKDAVNARIVNGLPIIRNNTDEQSVVFASASTSTSGTRQKTMFNLIFENVEDADEFSMWWYAKNGSIKDWLAKETSLKGKAAEPSKKPLGESTNQKSTIDEASAKMRRCNLKTSDNKKDSPAFGNTNGSRNCESSSEESDDSDEREEVEIDWNEAPQTQDWASSFAYDAA